MGKVIKFENKRKNKDNVNVSREFMNAFNHLKAMSDRDLLVCKVKK